MATSEYGQLSAIYLSAHLYNIGFENITAVQTYSLADGSCTFLKHFQQTCRF